MSRLLGLFVRRIVVEGNSMVPSYVPGERLTALRHWRKIRVGDVVIVRDPRDQDRWLLKRCVARVGRQLDLRGDNPAASTDSREFGPVPGHSVQWIVITPKGK